MGKDVLTSQSGGKKDRKWGKEIQQSLNDKAQCTPLPNSLCSDKVIVEKGKKSKTEKAFLKSYRGWGSSEISNHVMASNWYRGISAQAETTGQAKLIMACLTLILAESADGGRMLRRKSDLYVLTQCFDI